MKTESVFNHRHIIGGKATGLAGTHSHTLEEVDAAIAAVEAQLVLLDQRIAALETPPVEPPPVEPPPVEPPPVEPPPVATGLYGPGIQFDVLANTTLGGSNHPMKSTMRFRSERTAKLDSFRIYMLGAASGSGYGGGTSGKARFTVQTDSAGRPSGNVLAEVIVTPQNTGGVEFAFPSPPSLTAGTIYHLVCENVDSNPTANYFALDYGYVSKPTVPMQPRWPDDSWAHAYWENGWVDRKGHTPILDLQFNDGSHQGFGYMEQSYGSGQIGKISGNNMVRERFTVSAPTSTRTKIAVRINRESGSNPLVVEVRNGAGVVMATASLPASAFGVGGSNDYGSEGKWVEGTLNTPVTLNKGVVYEIRCSTAAPSVYWAFAPRKGVSYGYDKATYFADGYAEKTTGVAWLSLGRVDTQNDLQFYLR